MARIEISGWVVCYVQNISRKDMDHFVNCKHYETQHEDIDWKQILENHVEKQYEIAEFIYNRQVERERALELLKGGQPMVSGSGAPGDISTVEQCSSNILE